MPWLLLLFPPLALLTYVLLTQARAWWWFHAHDRPLPRPLGLPWLVIQLREALNMVRVGLGWALGLGQDGWWPPHGDTPGRPLLFVHGFTQNGSNWLRLRRRFQREGRGSMAVSLGLPTRTQDHYADRLERVLEGLVDAWGQVDVVCHSMGGLVLRRVLQRRPDLCSAIQQAMTIATPHHGTGATYLAPRGLLDEVDSMRIGGPWLDGLPCLTELLPHADLVTAGSIDDTIVYPVETTMLPGVPHISLEGLGHAGAIVDPTAPERLALPGSREVPTEDNPLRV